MGGANGEQFLPFHLRAVTRVHPEAPQSTVAEDVLIHGDARRPVFFLFACFLFDPRQNLAVPLFA